MEDLKIRFNDLKNKLDIETIRNRIIMLEKESQEAKFWQNHQNAAQSMKELSDLKKEIENIELVELYIEENDFENAEKLLSSLEKNTYYKSKHDLGSAILSIHAGQGGTEAMDWAEMLYRMYTRYFELSGYKFEVIDQTPGEETGIKSITINVDGRYAYGNLKFEAGVHRLVRQSPFNADKLRQTSFALVEVLPELIDDSGIEINEDELEWDFYRSGGKGGQNVNKVSTAVRLKHTPTGIVVTAQSQRHQGQNREQALKLLKAILWNKHEEAKKNEEMKLKGGYKTPGWGNQIRSYVLHPYQMVKDLRTGYETADTQSVLNGNIDKFIEEELKTLS